MKKCKLLYFVSEDEYFLSHKVAQAKKALENNFEVIILTKFSKYEKKIKSMGFKTQNINFDRKSVNPIKEFLCFISFCKTVMIIKPDIIQSIALKPILYTSIISGILCKKIKLIFCVVGLGYLFLNKKLVTRFFKFVFLTLLKLFISKKNSIFIFQNKDDLSFFLENKVVTTDKFKIIKGSGVDTLKFAKKNTKKIYDIILHSRLLVDKGIFELIDAIIHLRKKKIFLKVLLLGKPDKKNRSSISKDQILIWQSKKIIIWKGKVENVIPYLNKSKISILPSYREGLPKSLLEAASCGLPIIATDVPGCREICKNNYNGILVAPKNPLSIANAIEKLLKNSNLIKKFGENSRKLVIKNFSDKIVSNQFLKTYQSSN